MKKDQFYSLVDRSRIEDAVHGRETPCYLLFRSVLHRQVQRLRDCFKGRFEIHYALKANPNPAIVAELAALGCGADVASAGELEIALDAGVTPDRIEFSGPGKGTAELALAINRDIASINVESLEEIEQIAVLCASLGKRANIGIRLNPRDPQGRSGMRMAGDTQFGLTPEDASAAMQRLTVLKNRMQFTGFHGHICSQELSADAIAANVRTVLTQVRELSDQSPLVPAKVNLGGGLGIAYFPNQSDLDLDSLSKQLLDILDSDDARALPKDVRLLFEPGRFLVGECGIFATRVRYRKKAATKSFLVTDGGMNANYVLAGGMGQVIRRNFEMDALLDSRPGSADTQAFDVAGPLCTPQDVLASGFETSADIGRGDTLIFFNCGAYGRTASPVRFLSHAEPDEYLIDD